MNKLKLAIVATLILLMAFGVYAAGFEGRYCELDGATTEDGEQVTGECYMYSDQYGELDGAQTETGESVTGECYRYSENYAELEGAKTESGKTVSGECYFY